MASVEHPDAAPRFGFTAYADGTPRSQPFDRWAIDETFSRDEDTTRDGDDAPAPSLGRDARLPVIAWLAVASAVAAAAFGATVLIRVDHVTKGPAPSAPTAAAASDRVAPHPNAPIPSDAQTPPTVAPSPLAEAPRARAPAKAHHAAHRAAHAGAAPLDCGRSASAAERAVCGSPTLMAEERRMSGAYAAAQAAGAPSRTLRRDQARWLTARDAAARRSRYAVAALYRSRIEDLNSRPYRACGAYAADRQAAVERSGRTRLGRVTHWFLSMPRRIVSPGHRSACR